MSTVNLDKLRSTVYDIRFTLAKMRDDTTIFDAVTRFYSVTTVMAYVPAVLIMYIIFHVAYMNIKNETLAFLFVFTFIVMGCIGMYTVFNKIKSSQ